MQPAKLHMKCHICIASAVKHRALLDTPTTHTILAHATLSFCCITFITQVIKTFSMRKLVAYMIGIRRNIGVKRKETRV